MKTEPDIQVSPSAVARYREMMAAKNQAGFGLRIRVVSGGCSGMQYEMGFEAQAAAEDVVIESNGQQIFIDPKSLDYLQGLRIDYQKGLTNAGFKIFNPNVKGQCGCGESFS